MRPVLLMLVVAVACSKRSSRSDEELGPMPLPNWTVAIPAGWFSMGCSRVLRIEPAEVNKDQLFKEYMALERCASEDPPRRVWVSAFEIDRLETTETDYKRCVDAGGCDRSYQSAPVMTLLNYHPNSPPGPNRPVFLEHAQAARYCAWRGMRLPTQAEWEKAARGEDERIFAWGDDPPTCERTRDSSYRQLVKIECDAEEWFRPVGLRPAGASAYGLLDMEDNAPEWTSDFYDPWAMDELEIRDAPHRRDRRGDYTIVTLDWSAVRARWRDRVIDPRGPAVEPKRYPSDRPHPLYVAMGGATNAGISSVGHSTALPSLGKVDHAGVRCARSLPGPRPPNVQGPPIGELSEPFREPGYTGP